MLARLPSICLYLEEPSKERFYVHHMGNGQFHINGGPMIWPWTDVLNHYKQDPAFCPREDCLMDILFVATGVYKDRPITSFDCLCSDDSWLLVGTPYEPYKSLAKLPTGARLFIHRELEDCLSVVHRGGGLFEVPGQGPTLYNRHQLLAFYDKSVRGPKPSVDPLTTLYVEQGIHSGARLDLLFTASLTDELWARVGVVEPEASPLTPVRVPPVATEPPPLEHKEHKKRLFGRYEPEPRAPPPPHKNPFRKALHLPPKLRVTYQERPAIVTHERPLYKDKALIHLQFLDGSKETVTFFGTTDEEDEDYEPFKRMRLNSSAPISLLCLLSYSPERIATETTDRWPQEPEEESVSALLERLSEKETALQGELKDLNKAADLYERVAALEIQVQEALMYAPLDDEATLREREREAEEELGRMERLTKRSKDLDIRIGRARSIWCCEELADGEAGLAKREEEAAKELAELEVLEKRVAALRALEKRVLEARKVLETV
jgi:hypothetical protein